MNKVITHIFLIAAIASLSAVAFGQKQAQDSKEPLAPTASANTQIVGIDPTKNVVAVQNLTSGPLSVSVANTTGRVPFQIRGGFEVFAGGPNSGTEQYLVIPDGKRFVIENITARAEIPNGENLELSFLSRVDLPNVGAMYQYIPMSSQGVFVDKNVLMGSHKTLAYSVYRLQVRARPTWGTGLVGYADFTFSGYLENL